MTAPNKKPSADEIQAALRQTAADYSASKPKLHQPPKKPRGRPKSAHIAKTEADKIAKDIERAEFMAFANPNVEPAPRGKKGPKAQGPSGSFFKPSTASPQSHTPETDDNELTETPKPKRWRKFKDHHSSVFGQGKNPKERFIKALGEEPIKAVTVQDLEVSADADEQLIALQRTVSDTEAMLCVRARHDPAAFAAYVIKDDETGRNIKLQPMHWEWHKLISTYRKTLIFAHVEAGKTSAISVARALFEIGKNPNIRIVIISNTDEQAQKICRSIAKYITTSAEYHEVFPHVKPLNGAGGSWSSHALVVERETFAKDPTVQTVGVQGNILGARIDLLIIDDVLDYENTFTDYQRNKLYDWFNATIEGRMTANSRMICVGTAWNKDDIMHRWARRGDWFALRYPVLNDNGTSSWPAKWPIDRINERRLTGIIEFNRQLMCIARDDSESRFKVAWIKKALSQGEGRLPTHALQVIPPGYSVYTGCDVGVKKQMGADFSVLCTIIVHPNGTRELLEITSGRWGGPELVRRILDVHMRFGSIVIVENNAAQDFVLQFTNEVSAVPVLPFTTGANKHSLEFGVESLGVEMETGKWIIPSTIGGLPANKEIGALIQEMTSYDPEAHTGDRLMALWFAREGTRMRIPKGYTRRIDTISR